MTARFARLLFLLWTAWLPACWHGFPSAIPRQQAHAEPQFTGRFVAEGDGMTFAWTGSTIHAHFFGTQVGLKMEDVHPPAAGKQGNMYDVIVDDRPPQVLAMVQGTHLYPIAQDLPAGEHDITVMKRTEAVVGEGRFFGFDLGPQGHMLAAPARRARRLEFLGDSISAGYGNEGANEHCTFTPQTENGASAFGPLTARALNAEAVVLAWSGKGVSRNRDGTIEDTLPQLYRRALPGRATSTWDFQQAVPDAVVINLSTNDFGPGVPEAAAFTQAYLQLLKTVRQNYPQAYILCLLGPMLGDTFPAKQHQLTVARGYTQEVVRLARAQGDARVGFLEFPMQTGDRGYGCDWHPSLATHAAMAAQLSAALQQALNWF